MRNHAIFACTHPTRTLTLQQTGLFRYSIRLTEIQWQLTGRNPHVTLNDLGDRALITTSGTDTKVSVRIKAKNGCGELSRDFDVNP